MAARSTVIASAQFGETMRVPLLISVAVIIGVWGCSNPGGQTKVNKGQLAAVPTKDSPKPMFAAPVPGSAEMEVWNGELSLFQAKDIGVYMSLWDDNFVGWPDYSEYPLRKSDIEASASEEFRATKPSPALPAPVPLAVTVFGDVAVTQYFWPEADETSPVRYRTTHTWKKGPHGWRIISGMACEVPRNIRPTGTR